MATEGVNTAAASISVIARRVIIGFLHGGETIAVPHRYGVLGSLDRPHQGLEAIAETLVAIVVELCR